MKVRADLLDLKAYSSARSLCLEADIFLDANEGLNEWEFTSYPQPRPNDLIKKLALYNNVSEENICALRGSDEAIDLILRLFVDIRKDEKIAQLGPTYGVYAVASKIQGAGIIQYPLTKVTTGNKEVTNKIDFDLLKNNWDNSIKVLFICTPNNPCGTAFSEQQIEELIIFSRDKCILVIDEAYGEYSSKKSYTDRCAAEKHLIVLKTLSKAWSAAGLRIGYSISNRELISWFEKIRAPYPLPTPCIEIACQLLEKPSQLKKDMEAVNNIKYEFLDFLKTCDFVEEIYKSDANFILCRVKNANKLYDFLAAKKIIVRNFHSKIDNHIRFSISSPKKMQPLIQGLKEYSI